MKNDYKKDRFVAKSFDTKVSVIEKKYGIDPNTNSDKKLGNYLEEIGFKSLAEMLKS